MLYLESRYRKDCLICMYISSVNKAARPYPLRVTRAVKGGGFHEKAGRNPGIWPDLSGCIRDTPFHDDNWVLLRYRKNKRAFAWTYERDGHIWVNVKVDPEWRDFWRNTYDSVVPGYHQNKEHWNSIILDGTIPDEDIRRMVAESYDLISEKK